jgi:S-adenosylmethionine/arginine decarboxylase-like enzyme
VKIQKSPGTGFGKELVIDLTDCRRESISDSVVLETWVTSLVREIGMKAFGPPLIDHFGHANPVTSGYTVVQRIETSLISAHFSEGNLTAHINVFSCQDFDHREAVKHCTRTFGGLVAAARVLNR